MKTKFFLSLLTLTSVIAVSIQSAIAQTYQPTNRAPVADNTLGTQVSGDGNNFNITGGVTKGQTLLQSFTDFSVPTNGSANFANPVGNRDIITRVTGNLFSDINGTVNTNGANFFLINPNGIVFGTNARLNVGKAFVGSTANSIDLVDTGGRTMTFGTNPNGDAPLLSIAPNVLFDVSRLNLGGGNGAISNFGTLQTLNNSQYIGLIGGNVTLNGSAGGGKIIAPGGRVDIGGLNGAGSVNIDNNGLVFSSTGVGRSDVVLTNDAGITVRATGTLDTVNTFFNNATSNGSSINISANNLDLLNSGAKVNNRPVALDAGLEINLGLQNKAAGDINIDATGNVSLNNADLKNTLPASAEGNIGGIKIQAGTLDLKNNSMILSLTDGKGNAGDIKITANGDIKVSGDIASTNSTRSSIGSDTSGQGDAGKITIDTQGNLSVNNGSIYSRIIGAAVGNSKGISINARELEIANNSYITTQTDQTKRVDGKGNAGDINIKTTGDIKVSGYDSSAKRTTESRIESSSSGQGDAGKITIDTQGNLSVVNNGLINNNIYKTAVGNSKDISINARELELANNSLISTQTFQPERVDGKGNAGDINIKTTGDIKVFGSVIGSDTFGQGDAGKITIDTQGKLSINNGRISSTIAGAAVGNSQGISINAGELELANNSSIITQTIQTERVDGKGKAGDINIKTTGDIKVSGYDSSAINSTTYSRIDSSSSGQGDAGKITIDTQGKLSLVNKGLINNTIYETAVGNSKGISINARELELANNSWITTQTFQTERVDFISTRTQTERVDGKGNAGDINIKTTGDIKVSGYDSSAINRDIYSQIDSSSSGQGDAGKITIDTQGKLSLVNNGFIINIVSNTAVGNSKDISINARELELANNSWITTQTFQTKRVDGKGNAGGINIKTTGDIKVSGDDSSAINRTMDSSRIDISSIGLPTPNSTRSGINSDTSGQGDAGKITIDTQGKLSVVNDGIIASSITKAAVGNSQGMSINVRELELANNSFISTRTLQTERVDGKGKAGDIILQAKDTISLNNVSAIATRSEGAGQAGNVSVTAAQLLLNKGGFSSTSTFGSGGNVIVALSGKLLMQNNSLITSLSGSPDKNDNGGNITISSPLIIALPGNNDITANAFQGTGGKVNITSQGLFGIQYRFIGSEFTNNDITASSTFGQSGTVNIDTPGTDPGRDSTELPNVTTDASNQISQVCSANNRQNKLTVTGRGGLPPNANDPLTSDVVWQDARAASSQPAVSSATTNPAILPPRAVGMVFDGKGKVTLVAAATPGQPTGTRVVCPQGVK